MWVFKLIFGCVLSVPKKVHVHWKSLSIFNNEISFSVEDGLEIFYLCTRLCLLNLVFCMVREFLGVGWICTKKVRLVGNGLVFFINV